MQQTVDRNGKQLGNLKIGFDKRFFAVKMCLNSDSSVVQSVERRTVNPYVTGSSPVRGAKFKNPAQGNLSGIFAFRDPLRSPSMQSYPGVGAIFLL